MAGNLVKPLLSLYGTEWRERGYGLWGDEVNSGIGLSFCRTGHADLPQMLQFADFRICGPYTFCYLRVSDLQTTYFLQFSDLQFVNPSNFGGLKKLPQIRKYIIFLLTNIIFICSNSNLRTTFGFWDGFETELFRSLEYTYIGKKKYKGKTDADLDQKH